MSVWDGQFCNCMHELEKRLGKKDRVKRICRNLKHTAKTIELEPQLECRDEDIAFWVPMTNEFICRACAESPYYQINFRRAA